MGTEYHFLNYVLFTEYLLPIVLMKKYSAKKDHSLGNPTGPGKWGMMGTRTADREWKVTEG